MHFRRNQAKTLTQRNLDHEYASQPIIRREESKAERRLLLGVTHYGHQGTAALGVSSLTFWGSTNFINLCGHEGGDVPGNFWQPGRKRILTGDGVLQIELGIHRSDGRVRGDQLALPVCVQESNY